VSESSHFRPAPQHPVSDQSDAPDQSDGKPKDTRRGSVDLLLAFSPPGGNPCALAASALRRPDALPAPRHGAAAVRRISTDWPDPARIFVHVMFLLVATGANDNSGLAVGAVTIDPELPRARVH